MPHDRAVPRLTVDPEQLLAAARAAQSAAEQAAGVAQAVLGLQPPDTGRADVSARLAWRLAQAGSAATAVARQTSGDAAALRLVSARYAAVESRAGGAGPCG